ncbi:glycerate kinase [Nocardia canadensis]|uniref:glycerate kinase n=1 Tax=Nocardia canadensis TaxID=3065238 RepID=UPI00292E9B1B|nr:glycerate kinase [Nocardia canadensis]
MVLAPDKFKGSLTAAQVAAALARGIERTAPDSDIRQLPVADGGEGTVEAFLAAGWRRVPLRAPGPTGVPVDTAYAVSGNAAVIELADVVGLAKIPGAQRDPLHAGTEGLGVVIAHALDRGARDLVVGLGGSAATDGGAGMLRGLGLRILDAMGNELPRGGAALVDARSIDRANMHPGLAHARMTLASDVDNPLLGPSGAVETYGPQKGAGPCERSVLTAALENWAGLLQPRHSPVYADQPGAGAAGGAGFGAIAVLGATSRPGIDLVLEVIEFPTRIADADMVVTGEGSLDAQSLHGKAPLGVRSAAAAAEVPVTVVAGRILLDDYQLRAAGFGAAYALSDLEPDTTRSMTHAADLLESIGARIGTVASAELGR